MKKIITKITGDPQVKKVKKLEKRIKEIDQAAVGLDGLNLEELSQLAEKYKGMISSGQKKVDDLLPEVFALVREISGRVLGLRHFDVQLIGGMVLHQGSIAEMRTGEGKTLVATLPVALNALSGDGVHVVTVNDYLARRDAGWMAPVYHAMGLSVGVIVGQSVSFIYDPEFSSDEHDDERLKHLRPVSRREAYAADITYGTNNEFGFDYLRDNMVGSQDELTQRKLSYAIVDEVDSILIDEARTPLIISAPSVGSDKQYKIFAQAVRKLDKDDYDLDEKMRSVNLTDKGVEKLESILKLDNLYSVDNVQSVYHLDQALKAETLFKLDRDYVISDGEIIIVDEFTGRLMHGRRYNEGLHQAIEAKEGVDVLQESMTLATISFQNYFRLYDKLSGMTGTAETEAEEFHTIYKLDVIPIPTNKPNRRDDLPDRIYKSELGKFSAIAKEVKNLQDKGQPVLIGTVSVEKNQLLSGLLKKYGVAHEVLNAKNNEKEAKIVSEAGQKGAVTLATNIAGRGTDIVLGEGVVELGGLHVIGTERHESRRIDNQLRGRSGRQGDPGTTQFYVSVEDDLMRIFGGDRIRSLMDRLGVDEETPIENRTITKSLVNAQKKVEGRNFDSRKNVVQYDDVMNRHRSVTYSRRREILENKDINKVIDNLIDNQLNRLANIKPEVVIDVKKTKQKAQDKIVQQRTNELVEMLDLSEKDKSKLLKTSEKDWLEKARDIARKRYLERENEIGQVNIRDLERQAYLQILDQLWMQHLENMQHLREGINWRSVGQRDPLVEYRREGQIMYETMQSELANEVVRFVYQAKPVDSPSEEVQTELTKLAEGASEIGVDESGQSKTQQKRAKRNQNSNQHQKSAPTKSDVRKKKKQKRQARKQNRK